MWRKICSAPSPLPVYSSSCICLKNYKTWIWSAYEYDKYAKICTFPLLMVPCLCKSVWVWLRWLLLLASSSYSTVDPSVAEAMEAGFLPAPDTDQAYMFTLSELHWYWHAQGSQAGRWMKRLAWVPLKGYPRITEYEIIILTYPWLCNSGHLIPTYPWIYKSRHLIPTYYGLSQSTKSIKGYPWTFRLAQGVVIPDVGHYFSLTQNCQKYWKNSGQSSGFFKSHTPDCPTLPSVTDKTCCLPAFFGVDHKKKTVLLTNWSLEFTWTWRSQKNGWPNM